MVADTEATAMAADMAAVGMVSVAAGLASA